jgi:cobalt-zinc-cadmium efflux system outer membrane protein
MYRQIATLWLLVVAFCSLTLSSAAQPHNQSQTTVSNERTSILTSNDGHSNNIATSLTLDDAIELSLKYNPRLKAAGFEKHARKAAIRQASVFPNPELTTDVENISGSGSLQGTRSAEYTVGLSQDFEMGGKRTKRKELAESLFDVSVSSLATEQLDVIRLTSERFYSVLANQHRIGVSDSLLIVAKRFSDSVSRRREAGKVSPLEERRANILLANAQLHNEEARRRLTASWNDLREMWADIPNDATVVEGDLEEIIEVPPLQSLLGSIDQHPEVERSQSLIDYSRSKERLERAVSIPDVNLTVGARRIQELGATGITASLSLPLPLFNRNRGSIAEAQFESEATTALAHATLVGLQTKLKNLHAEVLSAKSEATLFGKGVVIDAMTNMVATVAGYESGKFDLLTVLDAQRVLFEISNHYVDALGRYHLSRINVEHLISASFSSLNEGGSDNE